MDLPKCKICGERHRLGPCSSDGGVEGHAAGVVPVKPVHGIGSEHRIRKERNGSQAGIKPGPSGAKFDRVAYQRGYMRKRRAKD
jgi:hypothetical protein